MKYGIDIGHNCSFDTGAVGIKKEDDLNREVGYKVIEKLKALGHEVVECTPKTARGVSDSLSQRVTKANLEKVEVFVSIHCNAGGGRGSEVFAVTSESKKIAQNVVDNIAALGYVNRGVKDGSKLYVVRKTNMISMLVECCFIDSKEDMTRFNAEDMANAIVKGLTGVNESEAIPTINIVKEKPIEVKPKESLIEKSKVLEIQRLLNKLKIGDSNGNMLIEDGLMGTKTAGSITKFQYIVKLKPSGTFDTDTKNAVGKILAKPLLKIGTNKYLETRYIQWRLNIYVDGIFGTDTRVAVIKFQNQKKLVADGIVGENTWKALINF